MKNVFQILLFLGLATASFNFAQSDNVSTAIELSTEETCYECKYDQCHATAKSTGKRCKHCVSSYGDKYCWQHR